MNDKMREIMEQKEEILKQLDEINNSITEEDLRKASTKEIAEYTKLTLEMQKKLMVIEAIEKSLQQ